MKQTRQFKNFEKLTEFVNNLSAQEIAEISAHYKAEWEFEVSSPEEIIEFLEWADYDWDCAQDDGLSPEEYVFFWK